MSLALRVTSRLVRLTGRFERAENLHARAYPAAPPPPAAMLRRYVAGTRLIHGQPVLTLTPRAGARGTQVIYTHGGAYVHPMVTAQWWIVDQMTRGTGVTITVPFYRLAPEGYVEDAYRLLDQVHGEVADRHGADQVTLAGDSAGAALALGRAIVIRDSGAPAPKQVIALSPWLDIALTNPAARALQPHDPMLTVDALVDAGLLWCRDTDPRDPRVSPLHADLAGLPPVHIVQGGRDVLAPDAELGARRLRAAGVCGDLHLEPGGFHNYLGAYWTPEARTGLARVRGWLSR